MAMMMLFLVILSLVLGGTGLALFLWALRSGQYDDLDGAANRILFDDVPVQSGPSTTIGAATTGANAAPDLRHRA
jgi:cbb3-type cytochrome oxidase maturation protein